MIKFIIIFLFITIASCSETSKALKIESSSKVKISFDKEFRDFKGRLYLKVNQSDSLSSLGRYFDIEGDSTDVLVIADNFGTINTLLDSLERVVPVSTEGVLLYLTNSENQNDFRIINYSVPDSAFYVNRLSVGKYSKNTKFEDEHIHLLRFRFFKK